MEWNIAKCLLLSLEDKNIPSERREELYCALGVTKQNAEALAEFMRAVARAEIENVAVALECWHEDSSIGFEASMEYVFNDEFAEWKLKEMDRSISLLDKYMENI